MAFLVVGDPFGATTHADLMIRARELGIKTKTIHNASIMNAIGCCGLQLYSFGETVSIPFWTEDWQPDSFFDKIQVNFIKRSRISGVLFSKFRICFAIVVQSSPFFMNSFRNFSNFYGEIPG